jgi:hypothetical protein
MDYRLIRAKARAEQRRIDARVRKLLAKGPLLSAELIEEAVAFADAHNEPLLRRLCRPRKSEQLVLAMYVNKGYDYHFSAPDVEAMRMPRRRLLDWLREELESGSEGKHVDLLERALGDAYVEGLRDRIYRLGGKALDTKTFAKAFGGPDASDRAAMTAWLKEDAPIDEVTGDCDYEYLTSALRRLSSAYSAMEGAVSVCRAFLPWTHPNTGEKVGWIGPIASMCSDGTLEATTAEAVTCLQWASDLLGLGIRLETRAY